MNEHQLSKRLSVVANWIPTGSRIADIGSDHAYLPVYLALQGKICYAIAGEVNDGPYERAKEQVERLGLDGVVEVHKGDGLQVIEKDEIDVIIIAGMGGALIRDILEDGKDKLDKIQRLILQPNVAAPLIREWLLKNGWMLLHETVVAEDEHHYEVLAAERGGDVMKPYHEAQIEFPDLTIETLTTVGPYLIKEASSAFIEKWSSDIEKKKRILKSIGQSTAVESIEKRNHLEQEIRRIEEVLSLCQQRS